MSIQDIVLKSGGLDEKRHIIARDRTYFQTFKASSLQYITAV